MHPGGAGPGIFLGVSAALCWGVADFLARSASRRIGSYRTSFALQMSGFAAITLVMAALGKFGPARTATDWHPWAWGGVAGLLNAVCSVMLYHSFEVGVLSVVAPIASSYSVLTAALSILSGERLTPLRGLGMAAAVVGVVLASTSSLPEGSSAEAHAHHRHKMSRGVVWAILAALGYGVMFWLLGYHAIPQLGGYMTVWVSRVVTFVALLVAAKPLGQSIAIPTGSIWWLLVAIGVTDTAAFLANNIGEQFGPVSIVAVLASMFAAVTVLLGWVILKERLERSQWFGVALIFAGIVAVSL
jgi:drug/metabolite transporter (DMT)-like permease